MNQQNDKTQTEIVNQIRMRRPFGTFLTVLKQNIEKYK